MTFGMIILILLGWALAFRWGFIMGRDEWRSLYDKCMSSKASSPLQSSHQNDQQRILQDLSVALSMPPSLEGSAAIQSYLKLLEEEKTTS